MPCGAGPRRSRGSRPRSPQSAAPDPQLEEIKRGLDRATQAIESLSELVGLGLREVEPDHPGAARPDAQQPEGCPGADQREHRAGQLAVPEHRQEDVRRDGPAGIPLTVEDSRPGRVADRRQRTGLGIPVEDEDEERFMRRNRRGGGSGLEFGGSGEDSFVAVVVTKLTGALLFILLLTMVIMALLPKAVDMAPPGAQGRHGPGRKPLRPRW